ncbi:MAG TPA: glycosyltransferase family 2 protein [Luteibaculaceae bacterium]|nr:glycosyltransferase family 2 protein [Luteibaculaceae bacterium]
MESSQRRMELSVIIPIFNEEAIIDELYHRLVKSVSACVDRFELIFINDGSKDQSLVCLQRLAEQDPRVKYLGFSRNFGHQIAVTAGLDVCTGKAVVIIDGDLQDPPEVIPELYASYKKGFEVVYARRLAREGETFFKKWSAKLFYRLLRRITAVDMPLDTGDFRLIDEKIVHYLRQMPEQNKFLRGQIAWLGFRQTGVYFKREKRRHGSTGYSLAKMIRFALDGITGFSDVPIKLVSRLGLLISLFSFAVILYALYSYFLLNRTITGWTSLIMSSMFIGGVQLLSIGIIGEYIGRINKNVQHRPLYIVSDSNMIKDPVEMDMQPK